MPSSANGTNAAPTVQVSGGGAQHVPFVGRLTATFNDPDGDAVAITWSGCASGQSGPNAVCSLPTVGTITASATARDGRGGVATQFVSLTGTNAGPATVTVTAAPPSCPAPCTPTFSATATDPDGDALVFSWSGCALGQTGPSATCSIKVPGLAGATATATDGRGGTASGSAQATGTARDPADNTPPVADPGGPYRGVAGQAVAFDGRRSNDPDGSIAAYTWSFGDGGTATGPVPRHVYAAAGAYTVSLTVRDDRAATVTAMVPVPVVTSLDPDGDSSNDAEQALGTDPQKADTNSDGIPDGVAVALGISPTSPDVDGDGIPNATEIATRTDPLRADTDGDRVNDNLDCFRSILRAATVRHPIPMITPRR